MTETRTVTRRALLGATAAIGAVGLPAMVAAETVIPALDLDAGLFALLDRWHEARAAWEATAEPYDAAQTRARAVYPPRPDALRSGFGDQCFSLGSSASGREPTPSGRIGMFFTSENVSRLRSCKPVTQWAMAVDGVQPTPREPDPKGEARRQEIIAANDGWERARTAVEDATGHTTEVEITRAAAAAVDAAEDDVKLHQPRTLAGLARKALWVADLLARETGDDDLAETFVRQVAAFGGVVDARPEPGRPPDTFDAGAFLADLEGAGCGVVLMAPGTAFRPSDAAATYFIRPSKGYTAVMARWADRMDACPDAHERVAARLTAMRGVAT